jgi:hypothetical protein
LVDGVFFVATPTADSISIQPASDDVPAWAFLYAQDVQGSRAEPRKRETDVVVMAKLQKGSAGRATLATEVLESIIEFRTFNLRAEGGPMSETTGQTTHSDAVSPVRRTPLVIRLFPGTRHN